MYIFKPHPDLRTENYSEIQLFQYTIDCNLLIQERKFFISFFPEVHIPFVMARSVSSMKMNIDTEYLTTCIMTQCKLH